MQPPARPGSCRGRYLATALDTGLQIGVDEFETSHGPTGWTLVSRHTPFGVGVGTGIGAASAAAAGHVARFDLDEGWVPRRLEVESTHGASLVAEFHSRRTVLHVRRAPGTGPEREERIALPVGRHEALVLLAGGLSLPLLAVRRALRLDGGAALQFTLLPDGLCELRREPDRPRDHKRPPDNDGGRDDACLRLFDMRLMLGADRDRLRLAVDARGDLVRFHARNRNLLVELDTAGAC